MYYSLKLCQSVGYSSAVYQGIGHFEIERLFVRASMVVLVGSCWSMDRNVCLLHASYLGFLVACARLYTPLCPSVGWLVCWSVTLFTYFINYFLSRYKSF